LSYLYIPRSEFDYDLAEILQPLPDPARAVLESITKAVVVRLVEGSIQGEPLHGRLSDCLKFKFDLPASQRGLYPASETDPAPRWRVVYRIFDMELRSGRSQERLDVLSVGRRGELAAYRMAAKRLRRGG
jgi:hypothetical protein